MSVTGSQIDLEDGETEKIITDDQGNRTYLVEVVGANAIRVSHNKRYAADGTTLSAGQTHTVSNLQGQQLFAAAYDGQTAIRVREASADVQSQPEKEVSVIDGSVDIAGDIDISDRSGREIGKARLEDSSGTLIDPATSADLAQTQPREITSYTGSEIPVSISTATISDYTGSALPTDTIGTDPIVAQTSTDGASNAAELILGKRSNTDVMYDLSGSAEVIVEVSKDGSEWLERERITTDGSGSILLTVAFEYARAYATSSTNSITIAAKGGN